MLQIGDIRIHLINDGDHRVDPGGAFGLVPRVLWSRYFTPDENHLIPMVLNCLLVQTGDRTMLIDTGYGTKLSQKQRGFLHLSRPNGGLVEGLARLNLAPRDIDLVIDTHLHGDHCAGNTYYDEGGNLVATFPNAEYVVQRREYDDAIHPNERTRATYLAENFQPLVESGQMRLLNGDEEVAPGVRVVVTPGHTPGHSSVVFESNGEYGIFLCDMASYAVHFERLGWMTAYDVEPLVTLETKRKWQQWVLEHNAIVLFPHDAFRPAGRLQQHDDGRLQVVSLDEAFV
ncbi:MAG: MBL fold metallo-hydrolase [Phototrophicales bacterium]|nr:MAG: MBL fold metallo-hydrolase [Phototrophicales bacterium]